MIHGVYCSINQQRIITKSSNLVGLGNDLVIGYPRNDIWFWDFEVIG